MGNTLKMDKIAVLNRLFEAGWSNRKINNTIGINRRTVSRYRFEWEQQKRSEADVKDHNDHNGKQVTEAKDLVQNAPLGGCNKWCILKCPLTGNQKFLIPL